MQAAKINGSNLHFRLAGPESGVTLAFVNSLGTDWRVWEPVADRLGDGCRLLFHDKRGHGLSDTPDGPLSMDDHVGDLAALLDHLEIEGAVVCGLSVGGMIALGLAAARPELVRALVLCDTGHRIGTEALWDQRIQEIRQHGLEHIAEGVMARWFSAPFRAEHPAEATAWRNMLVRTPVAGYTATCAAIRDSDFTEAARSTVVPALCLCGTADLATTPELVRELARLIPDSRYRDIDGAGHLPTVEAPVEVAAAINEFLSEQGLD